MAYPPTLGGAGIHNLSTRNKVFGGKLVWQMYTKPHSLWCQIMQQKYLDNNEPHRIFSMLDPPKGSVIWDFMIASRDIVLNNIYWELNCGDKINFQGDSWNGHLPLN